MREGTAVSGIQRKTHLKSGLMIGAAGLAAAGFSTGAMAGDGAPKDAPKWMPWAAVGAGVGDATAGVELQGFAPVWQDMDSLLFVRAGIGTQTRDDTILNFGLGYRTKIDPEWILGLYAGYNSSHTKYGHTFDQITLGAELMSADWDARINGYIATEDKLKAIANSYALYIHDTQIAILQGQEGAYSGVDGEVGYRVFHTDNVDARLFAGGFYFSRNGSHATSLGQTFNFAYGDIAGPMGRAEVDIYDIDALGAQSRLTLEGRISHDDVRGTSGYVGASLRIPIGAGWGEGGQALDDLDRRMVDPVRDQGNVLTQWEYSKPEPVVIYNGSITSRPTNTLYYVQGGASGAGSYSNPTNLDDAATRSATNPFIVVTDFGGDVAGMDPGHTVTSGASIVGGGTSWGVVGYNSGATFTHSFAPASGTPTLVPQAPGYNVINLGDDTRLYNLDFYGPFKYAVYGNDISYGVISHVTIDGSAAGFAGVVVEQDQSQDLYLRVDNSSIYDTYVGIFVGTHVYDGGTSNQTINIDNDVLANYFDNLAVVTIVGGGSTVNQYVTVDPTYVYGGVYGVGFYTNAFGGGTVNQSIMLDHVHVYGAKYGVRIDALAGVGGTINQSIGFNYVYAYGGYMPISIFGGATYAGAVTQQIDMNYVTAKYAALYDNIAVRAEAKYGGSVTQYGSWSHVVANLGYRDGVRIAGTVDTGGAVGQSFDISYLYAIGNGYDGLGVHGYAYGASGLYGLSLVAQYITLDHAYLAGNNVNGLHATTFATGYYGATLQWLNVSYSDVAYNHNGLYALSNAKYGGSTEQYVRLSNSVFNYNDYDGAAFVSRAKYGGFASQTVYGIYSDFSHNGDNGMLISGVAKYGGNVEQNAFLYYSSFLDNVNDGLAIFSAATGYAIGPYYVYYSQITQNVIAYGDSFKYNGGNGVFVSNDAYNGGQINQFLYFGNSSFKYNGISGLYETSFSNAYGPVFVVPTNIYSSLYVVNSNAKYNGLDGITVSSTQGGPGYLIQYITVDGVDASYNGRSGFVDLAHAYGIYSLNYQSITLSNSYFDGNGLDGADITATQKYGPGNLGTTIDRVLIAYSDFSGNYRDGLYASATAKYNNGRAEQHFQIFDSYFDANGRDGIHVTNFAGYGVYVAGYPCSAVQGSAGGCAIVRSTIYMYGSHADYNVANGIYISNTATGYGAIYNYYGRPYFPTVFLVGSTADGNGADGLYLHNSATSASYLYQYVLAANTHFDGNTVNGIHGENYVSGPSQLLQLVTLYSYYNYYNPYASTTVNYNSANGVQITSVGVGYAPNSLLYTGLVLYGADVSYNSSQGVTLEQYSNGLAGSTQVVDALFSTFYGNGGFGISVFSSSSLDAFSGQSVYAFGNTFKYNGGPAGLSVSQIDTGSLYAQQYVLAKYNAFVGNTTGLTQLASLTGTTYGSQYSNLFDNYFIGGDLAGPGLKPGDGAQIAFLTDGVTYGQAIQIAALNTFKYVPGDALYINVDSGYGSRVGNLTDVVDNFIYYTGGAGISVNMESHDSAYLYNSLYSPYGVIIGYNAVYDTGILSVSDAIGVNLTASTGSIYGTVSPYFFTLIDSNTVYGTTGNGIGVHTYNTGGVILSGAAIGYFGANYAGGAAGYGIAVTSYNNAGVTGEYNLIWNNTANFNGLGGIAVNNYMTGGVSVIYSGIFGNYAASNGTFGGINVVDIGTGGVLIDTSNIFGNEFGLQPRRCRSLHRGRCFCGPIQLRSGQSADHQRLRRARLLRRHDLSVRQGAGRQPESLPVRGLLPVLRNGHRRPGALIEPEPARQRKAAGPKSRRLRFWRGDAGVRSDYIRIILNYLIHGPDRPIFWAKQWRSPWTSISGSRRPTAKPSPTGSPRCWPTPTCSIRRPTPITGT